MSGTTGTPRTQSYLLTTEFQDGQPSQSISPQRLRDFVTSTVPWDDPANSSSLGAPAILREKIDLSRVSGFTQGTGLSTGIRTANFTALQAAITYAQANSLILEVPEMTYEFYGSGGLVIPFGSSGFTWRGTKTSNLRNFFANSPTLVIGDPTTYTNGCTFYDIDGVQCTSGCITNTIASTNANLLVIGSAAFSRFANICATADYGASSPSTPPYQCVWQTGGSAGAGDFFSNTCEDWEIGGALQTVLNYAGVSTGNVWKNIYVHQGTPTSGPLAVTGPVLQIGNSATNPAGENDIFEQVNVEWASSSGSNLININNHKNLVFNSLHIEGAALTQFVACVISGGTSTVSVNGITVEELACLTGSGAGAFACIFGSFGGCNFNVNNLRFEWSQYGFYSSTTVFVNETLPLFFVTGGEGDVNGSFTLNGLQVSDFSGGVNPTFLQLDANLPRANFAIPINAMQAYRNGYGKSVTTGAQFLVSATYTHYGSVEDATIYVPASITSFTLTLHTKVKASGTGSSLPTRTGNTAHVRRQSGTASGTLTIADSTAGTIGSPNTTSAVDLLYMFNGTAWVVAT